MRKILMLLLLVSGSMDANEGTWINPFTDICWECMFPITVSGVNVTPEAKDFTDYQTRICICAGTPPKVGIPISFWEPGKLIDVTRHPYKLMGLGGISLGKETVKNRGSVGLTDGSSTQTSFYHVHPRALRALRRPPP